MAVWPSSLVSSKILFVSNLLLQSEGNMIPSRKIVKNTCLVISPVFLRIVCVRENGDNALWLSSDKAYGLEDHLSCCYVLPRVSYFPFIFPAPNGSRQQAVAFVAGIGDAKKHGKTFSNRRRFLKDILNRNKNVPRFSVGTNNVPLDSRFM